MGSMFIEFRCPYCDWGIISYIRDDDQIHFEEEKEFYREFLKNHIEKDHNEKNNLDTN